MGCEVYANGNTIACKAADGKTVAAMPDVCLSPPSPPAGPIPIPYPNTGMASDTTEGSKTVQIAGQEVMLKNQSYFKQSSGDEAATKSLGMGVVTHQIQGKVNFINWSMDVKFEGENVPRHLDMTGHNEASDPPNCPPWPYLDGMALSPNSPCFEEAKKAAKKCAPEKDWQKNCPPAPPYPASNEQTNAYANAVQNNACLNARKCMLVPYENKDKNCCPSQPGQMGQTPHHIIDNACFVDPIPGVKRDAAPRIEGWKKYETDKAPCVCCEGYSWHKGTHSEMHVRSGVAALHHSDGDGMWSRQQATKDGAKALQKTFPDSHCSEKCITAQLDAYHDQAKSSDPEKPIKAAASMEADDAYKAIAAEEMGYPMVSTDSLNLG